jgi:hypothetical protein
MKLPADSGRFNLVIASLLDRAAAAQLAFVSVFPAFPSHLKFNKIERAFFFVYSSRVTHNHSNTVNQRFPGFPEKSE